MAEFQKVKTVSDLGNLDDAEVLRGYLSALDREPEPGSDKSRSFWHGWRNGIADRSGVTDAEQQQLAREYLGYPRHH